MLLPLLDILHCNIVLLSLYKIKIGLYLLNYIVKNKKYTFEKFRQPLEITSLNGNITTMDNEVYLHCHATLSDVNMDAIAGHLKEGVVGATCEIMLVQLDSRIERKRDEPIGLNLMEP